MVPRSRSDAAAERYVDDDDGYHDGGGVGSAAPSSFGIGGNRQPPGLMPTLMIGADRPAVPDVLRQRPVIGSIAMGGLGTARNKTAAHTALEPDVARTWSAPQSVSCIRYGSSDYAGIVEGPLQLAIARRSLGFGQSIYTSIARPLF
ncbi:hypothetical protein [Bradyrhizobium genosp. A]|uniref:hypothetical protein n=1 Tax=Bradyrhizobium genosp. A TaxID=83626 RepID=UPI003CFA3519